MKENTRKYKEHQVFSYQNYLNLRQELLFTSLACLKEVNFEMSFLVTSILTKKRTKKFNFTTIRAAGTYLNMVRTDHFEMGPLAPSDPKLEIG
jgi:hypothetical protein